MIYRIRQLMNGSNPSVSGNNIVFVADTNGIGTPGGADIFLYTDSSYLYDSRNLKQITNDAYNDYSPVVSGNNIAWYKESISNDYFDETYFSGVYFYNGNQTTNLSISRYVNYAPDISGSNVVWYGMPDQLLTYEGSETSAIYFYNGATTGKISSDSNEVYLSGSGPYPWYLPTFNHAVSGNNVVWAAYSTNYVTYSADPTIYLYDGSTTKSIHTVKGTNNIFFGLDISANNIVWSQIDSNGTEDVRDDDAEIYFYDGRQTIQITNDNSFDSRPVISGSRVVWQKYDGNDTEIYLYDNGRTTQLTNNDFDDFAPSISGNKIVWQGYTDPNGQIFVCDIITGLTDPGTVTRDSITHSVNFNIISPDSSVENRWTPNTHVWVVIHGWNDDPNTRFKALADTVSRARTGDIVLTLDWQKVADSSNGFNGAVATWIKAVADFAADKLRSWGLTDGRFLNLIGHSLGALVSSEIAARFGQANTITALDPPSEMNVLGGYDIDFAEPGTQRPKRFDSVSAFSRAFLGSRSLAGNDEFAGWAHESILMDYGRSLDVFQEHFWVVDGFRRLISPDLNDSSKLANNLFNLNSGIYSNFRRNSFRVWASPNVFRHEGVIKLNSPDTTLVFVARNSAATAGSSDHIVYGTNKDDQITPALFIDSTADNTIVDHFTPYDGGSDIFYGGNGNDLIRGGSGNDEINGDSGNDTLNGNAGNDTLNGGVGNDALDGEVGSDSMTGGTGNDTYFVDSTGDRAIEASTLTTEIDTVQSRVAYTLGANLENLTLIGNSSINGTGNALTNTIVGNGGSNLLNGGAGNDALNGGGGTDTLVGGQGNDTLVGGLGSDRFLYDTNAAFATAAIGIDTITDFGVSTDKIVLDKTTFTALTSAVGNGFSTASDFAVVTTDAAAAIITARIVYNRSNGRLFYNQNGAAAGFGTGAQLAAFTGNPALAASDFIIQ